MMTLSWSTYSSIALLAVSGLLIITLCTRWSSARRMWRRLIGHQPSNRLENLMSTLLARVTACNDYRRMGQTLLDTFTQLAGTAEGTLLLSNAEPNHYILYEVLGAKPGSFQVGDISHFLLWLKETRATVTRHALVNDTEMAKIKTSALQYCVQYHAEVCIPCFLGDDLIAIINLGPREDNSDYTEEFCVMLDRLSHIAAMAMHNLMLVETIFHQQKVVTKQVKLRTHFLSNISHELRTPVNSIVGLADHLLEQGLAVDPDEAHKHLHMIRESGGRLLHTVTALLDLAKLEAGREALDVRRVNMAKLLDDVRSDLLPSPTTQLDLNFGQDLPSIYGDEMWVRCLLHHLIDNAVKFTPDGRVWVDCERAGDMLKVGVHDTGVGIPAERHEGIFTGFVQVDNSASRSHEGTGVGLTISRRVVELHGGRLWMQSQPGDGSHFFFTLPLKPSMI